MGAEQRYRFYTNVDVSAFVIDNSDVSYKLDVQPMASGCLIHFVPTEYNEKTPMRSFLVLTWRLRDVGPRLAAKFAKYAVPSIFCGKAGEPLFLTAYWWIWKIM